MKTDFDFSLWVKIEPILRDTSHAKGPNKGFMTNYRTIDGAITTGIYTHNSIKLIFEKILQELPQSLQGSAKE